MSLLALAARRPIALVTGSTTCPATASAMPDLNRLEQRYGDCVQFVLLQVREAHPGAEVDQPYTLRDKVQHAQLMRKTYDVGWPVLVDDVDGTLHLQLDTEPNSLHIIAPDGEILYRALFAGAVGVENAIAAVAAGEQPTKKSSQSLLPILNSVGFMHDTVVLRGSRGLLQHGKGSAAHGGGGTGSETAPVRSQEEARSRPDDRLCRDSGGPCCARELTHLLRRLLSQQELENEHVCHKQRGHDDEGDEDHSSKLSSIHMPDSLRHGIRCVQRPLPH